MPKRNLNMSNFDTPSNKFSPSSIYPLSLFLILSCAHVFLSNAQAATITFNLDHINAGSAVDDRSDGTFDRFSTGGHLISAESRVTHFMDIYYVTRGIMEFDISALAEPIISAYLVMDVAGLNYTGTQGVPVSFYGYEADGIAGLSDAYLGDTLLGSAQINSTNSWKPLEINVTNYLNSIQASYNDFLGISMRTDTEYTSSQAGYRDEIDLSGTGFRDPDSPFFAPHLVITTVPIPTAIFLFISGLLAFGIIRRRDMS